jgi:hypothetical protein
MNLSYKFTGAITFSAAAGSPATATISVGAGQSLIGSNPISCNAMSVGVTGTGGTTVTYYLYIDDPEFDGGSKTLVATTSTTVTFQADGRVFIGSATVNFPTSGSSSGGGSGGGGACVHADSWVLTRRGPILARYVIPGFDWLRVLTDDGRGWTWQPCMYNKLGEEEGWLLRTEDGIELEVSDSAPLTLQDMTTTTPAELNGRKQATLSIDNVDNIRWVETDAIPIGRIPVAHIFCGDKVYAAGKTVGRYIATHNLKPVGDP